LNNQFYYVYARTGKKGSAQKTFGGSKNFCIKERVFNIRGVGECQERGFEEVGFFEVDTGAFGDDYTVSIK
jgi:uncharacterized membrane protein